MRRLDDLLLEAKGSDASDVHLSPSRPPLFRIDGKLKPIGEKLLTEIEIGGFVKKMIGTNIRSQELLKKHQQVDLSYSLPDKTRFRVNIFHSSGTLSVALRLISNVIKTIEELNLPSHILQLSELKQGFVIAAGPAGHGKSTTLASLIEHINQNRREHIITIEDPIEYVFTDNKSAIDQREIGHDATTFVRAMRATLRQDPNVILIGELRGLESMQTALSLAETGHLVFTTLHTNDAAQTVERLIDSFPPSQQSQIRSQLAATLSGVISQRLLPAVQGGRIPAVEIMITNTAIRNTIREGNIHQILGIIQTSAEVGMQTLDSSLEELIQAGSVTLEEANPYFRTDKGVIKSAPKI
jgi:twitching motility protein PilT